MLAVACMRGRLIISSISLSLLYNDGSYGLSSMSSRRTLKYFFSRSLHVLLYYELLFLLFLVRLLYYFLSCSES